jgi:hypothetical protein
VAPANAGPNDCARFESSTLTPTAASYTPGQKFRVEWRFFNCGNTDWTGYKAVRVEGVAGPTAFDVGNWPPNTPGSLWFEDTAPPNPGRYRIAYRLQGPRGPFTDFWVEILVGGAGAKP